MTASTLGAGKKTKLLIHEHLDTSSSSSSLSPPSLALVLTFSTKSRHPQLFPYPQKPRQMLLHLHVTRKTASASAFGKKLKKNNRALCQNGPSRCNGAAPACNVRKKAHDVRYIPSGSNDAETRAFRKRLHPSARLAPCPPPPPTHTRTSPFIAYLSLVMMISASSRRTTR